MFKRIVYAAMLAGLISGLILSVIQQIFVVPSILEAEKYEEGENEAALVPVSPLEVAHVENLIEEHDDGVTWTPENGLERTLYTFVSNILYAVSFGLMIAAGLSLRPVRKWWQGAYWGLAGLTVFYLVPSYIYAPTLPGTLEAELLMRQLWWIASIECGLIGLAMVFFTPYWMTRLLGGMLFFLPHLVGAPPGEIIIFVPKSLLNEFLIANLATTTVYWILLGLFTAYFFERLSRRLHVTVSTSSLTQSEVRL